MFFLTSRVEQYIIKVEDFASFELKIYSITLVLYSFSGLFDIEEFDDFFIFRYF